jgi:hypothetical protein
MTDDRISASADPEVGTPEYWRLSPEEQLRICEERSGLRAGTAGGFMAPGRPYTDPIQNPIDQW